MADTGGIKEWARIAARLREDITEGRLQLGEQLGTEHELAAQYGAARGTVVQALRQLRGEGLVITRHGQGTYVAVAPAVRTVTIGPGDVVCTRIPTVAERDRMQVPPAVPVFVIHRAAGTEELHDASVTQIVTEQGI